MAICFKKANKFRVIHGPMGTDINCVEGGLFFIPYGSARRMYKVIVGVGMGWEHISVSNSGKTPSWAVMCKIKELFWHEEDVVMQLHPKKSNYVNEHKHCLHLWRSLEKDIPTPPTIMV